MTRPLSLAETARWALDLKFVFSSSIFTYFLTVHVEKCRCCAISSSLAFPSPVILSIDKQPGFLPAVRLESILTSWHFDSCGKIFPGSCPDIPVSCLRMGIYTDPSTAVRSLKPDKCPVKRRLWNSHIRRPVILILIHHRILHQGNRHRT